MTDEPHIHTDSEGNATRVDPVEVYKVGPKAMAEEFDKATDAVRSVFGKPNLLRRLWAWLIKPANVWPNPPVPRDENSRGIGWAGDRRAVRPFDQDDQR